MGEIVLRVKVPENWGEEMRKAVERRLVVDVVKELQKRIEDAKKFEEIITGVRVEDEKEAKEIEEEFARDLAKRYGVV